MPDGLFDPCQIGFRRLVEVSQCMSMRNRNQIVQASMRQEHGHSRRDILSGDISIIEERLNQATTASGNTSQRKACLQQNGMGQHRALAESHGKDA